MPQVESGHDSRRLAQSSTTRHYEAQQSTWPSKEAFVSEEQKILDELSQAIIKGNPELARQKTQESLALGVDPFETIRAMQVAMGTVGMYYEQKRYYLTEMYMGAQAVQAASEVLRPHLKGMAGQAGRIVLGTVRNDIHDVGKNLVRIVLEANAFEVHDLGVNVPSHVFIQTA